MTAVSRAPLPDPADATRSDVERAVRIRLLKFGLGQYVQDVEDAVMGVVGEVIDRKDQRYARLLAERDTEPDHAP